MRKKPTAWVTNHMALAKSPSNLKRLGKIITETPTGQMASSINTFLATPNPSPVK